MDLIHPELSKPLAETKEDTCQRCSNEDCQYEYNDKPLCSQCYEDYYFTCESCHEVLHTDNYQEDGKCDECYWEDHFTCENCDEVYHQDNNYGNNLCSDCHSERYTYCEDCSTDIDNDDCQYIEGYGDICNVCFENSDLEVKDCRQCSSRCLANRITNGLCSYCSKRIENRIIHPTLIK